MNDASTRQVEANSLALLTPDEQVAERVVWGISAPIPSPHTDAVSTKFVILALVVVTALGFDFTNGFHDTGNAMATSIATGALKPKIAVACRRSSIWLARSCR